MKGNKMVFDESFFGKHAPKNKRSKKAFKYESDDDDDYEFDDDYDPADDWDDSFSEFRR